MGPSYKYFKHNFTTRTFFGSRFAHVGQNSQQNGFHAVLQLLKFVTNGSEVYWTYSVYMTASEGELKSLS